MHTSTYFVALFIAGWILMMKYYTSKAQKVDANDNPIDKFPEYPQEHLN